MTTEKHRTVPTLKRVLWVCVATSSASLTVQQCGIRLYCALVDHPLPAERGGKPALGGSRAHSVGVVTRPAIAAHSACHAAALAVQVCGDAKVANRDIRVWHGAIENGY